MSALPDYQIDPPQDPAELLEEAIEARAAEVLEDWQTGLWHSRERNVETAAVANFDSILDRAESERELRHWLRLLSSPRPTPAAMRELLDQFRQWLVTDQDLRARREAERQLWGDEEAAA